MKENFKDKNKKADFSEEKNNIFSEEKQQIQLLLDKYLAGETSNEEEELLRNYFEEHGDDISEEWKSFRALFSFVGFERLNFFAEEKSEEIPEVDSEETPETDSEESSAEEESIIEVSNIESSKKGNNESDKPQKAKQRSLRRYMVISAAAAVAIVLLITGIRSISSYQWGEAQSECYAVIDGKVCTNPEKVHDEALDALQGIGSEGQGDDAFEALNMMQ